MKKTNFLYALFIVLITSLSVSCKDKDEAMPPVELDAGGVDVLNFNSADLGKQVTIKANYEWNAKMLIPADSLWCKLKKKDNLLLVAPEANKSTKERSGKIVVECANGKDVKKIHIDVTQKKAEKAILLFDPERVLLTAEKAGGEVNIITNVSPVVYKWVGEAPEWLEAPQLNENRLTLKASDNIIKANRAAKLLVICGTPENEVKDTLVIMQNANAPYIEFENISAGDTLWLDYKGTEVSFGVNYNVPELKNNLKFDHLFGAPWFKVKEVEKPASKALELIAVEKSFVVYTEEENYEMQPRHWFAKFYFDNTYTEKEEINQAEVYKKFIISQKGGPKATLSVDKKSIKTKKNGGTEEIAVSSNYENWTAVSGDSWCHCTKKGDKLTITTDAYNGEKMRKTEVVLNCGGGKNIAKEILIVAQSGSKPGIVLETSEVVLNENGDEKTISVLTDLEDWGVNYTPDWHRISYNVEKGTITISAQKLEGGSRSVEVTVSGYAGSEEISVPLKISQNKNYKLGDLYMKEGKAVGIVYKIWDDGAHGLVFSLDQYDDLMNNGKRFSIDLYAGSPADPEELQKNKPVAFDFNDGRENMKAFKNREFTDGKDWKYHYPAAAWVDEFDTEHGSIGWYMPAANEVYDMFSFLDGFTYHAQGEIPSAEQKARHEDINRLIKDNGGKPFIYEVDYVTTFHPQLVYIMSSTEIMTDGYPHFYTMNFGIAWLFSIHSQGDLGDATDLAMGCIRPVLRF